MTEEQKVERKEPVAFPEVGVELLARGTYDAFALIDDAWVPVIRWNTLRVKAEQRLLGR
jgi:hypothetical protein